jgi:hypothetical protein
VELNVVRIRTGRGEDLGPKPREVNLGGTAVGVMKDRNAIDLELIHRLDERTQRVGCDACAGISHDVDVAHLEAKDGKGVDAAIHAGNDSNVLSGNRRKCFIGKSSGIRAVSIDKVPE